MTLQADRPVRRSELHPQSDAAVVEGSLSLDGFRRRASSVPGMSGELASTLAWGAANDYGWHVFLVNREAGEVLAHVMVEVTPDTPHEVFELLTRDPCER